MDYVVEVGTQEARRFPSLESAGLALRGRYGVGAVS